MNVIANCTQGCSGAVVKYLLPNLKVEGTRPPCAQILFRYTAGKFRRCRKLNRKFRPTCQKLFCSMYEMSQRYPVWVVENHVRACNSVRVVKMCKNAAWQRKLYADLIASSLFSSFFKRPVRSQILQCSH